MPFKLSKCVCLTTPESDKAREFYQQVMGMNVVGESGDGIEFGADPVRFFVNPGGQTTFAIEFIVPDLERAKEELTKAGCQVVKWEGKGRDCYIRDPFGVLFNLWEDPSAF